MTETMTVGALRRFPVKSMRGEALDHNLLLPLLLAGIVVGLGSWMLPLVGRPERVPRLPRWLVATLVVVVVAFTVARNLPGFDYLASDA